MKMMVDRTPVRTRLTHEEMRTKLRAGELSGFSMGEYMEYLAREMGNDPAVPGYYQLSNGCSAVRFPLDPENYADDMYPAGSRANADPRCFNPAARSVGQ